VGTVESPINRLNYGEEELSEQLEARYKLQCTNRHRPRHSRHRSCGVGPRKLALVSWNQNWLSSAHSAPRTALTNPTAYINQTTDVLQVRTAQSDLVRIDVLLSNVNIPASDKSPLVSQRIAATIHTCAVAKGITQVPLSSAVATFIKTACT
jgi:hypothetical protein